MMASSRFGSSEREFALINSQSNVPNGLKSEPTHVDCYDDLRRRQLSARLRWLNCGQVGKRGVVVNSDNPNSSARTKSLCTASALRAITRGKSDSSECRR